jgi:RNA polymerase sigma-70 factor (ECF subfamily)
MSSYDALNKQLNDEMQSLAEKIKSGNYTESHRNRLASLMYPKLKYYVWKFFNDSDEADEVLHNTLFKIFKGLDKYNPEYRFTTWIYTIAKNEALLHQHNLKIQQATSLESMVRSPYIPDNTEKIMENEISFETLYLATELEIKELPDGIEKSIIIDKELNHMKGHDIAEKYQMNLNTVKTKIRKARNTIKQRVAIKYPELTDFIKENFE